MVIVVMTRPVKRLKICVQKPTAMLSSADGGKEQETHAAQHLV